MEEVHTGDAPAAIGPYSQEIYDEVNDAYAEYMSDPFSARSAVEVADLPSDIEVIASR